MWRNNVCKKINGLLWNYAAQRLAENDVERVEAHLSRCAACRRQAAAYQQTVGSLRVYRAAGLPESQTTWRQLRQRLATDLPSALPERQRGLALASVSIAWVGAGLLLVTTLGVVGSRYFSSSNPDDAERTVITASGLRPPKEDFNRARSLSSVTADATSPVMLTAANRWVTTLAGSDIEISDVRLHRPWHHRRHHSAGFTMPAPSPQFIATTHGAQKPGSGSHTVGVLPSQTPDDATLAIQIPIVDGGYSEQERVRHDYVLPDTAPTDADTNTRYILDEIPSPASESDSVGSTPTRKETTGL